MEWFFNRQNDDCLVPGDRGVSNASFIDNGFPSSDDWFQWKVDMAEQCAPPAKYNSKPAKPNAEGFVRSGAYGNNGKEAFIQDDEGMSSSGVYGEASPDASLHDEQLKGLWQSVDQTGRMERMDNIFLDSYLEEAMFQESECQSASFENPLADMLIDSSGILKESSCTENTDNVEECDFALSMYQSSKDWDEAKDSFTGIEMLLSFLIPDEVKAARKTGIHGQKCLKENALQELEGVMTQLNVKTRICFRDSLYRLARSSNERYGKVQKNIEELEVDRPSQADSSRHGKMKCVEPDNNAIDRTITNMMFSQPCCGLPEISHADMKDEHIPT
ncbi:hypothetical protein QJS10_CPB17g01676 [Acorus calamus]|uniref:Uncharacterized protein n=1 Tax=Acorus calamus TaxID=4465 RepID=A0AAV9CSL5_ACOCL|nr:hypothetical protein QJS10_CPB17g01676 [Acorus calamus]